MTLFNKALVSNVETLFIMTDIKYSYISSSMVKEVARFGGLLNGIMPESTADKFGVKLS